MRRTMKRMINLSAALVFGLLSGMATNAYAALTGDLTISGTVDSVVAVEIYNAANDAAITTFTTLNMAGQAELQIATIHEQCNDPDGYTMTLDPANGTLALSYLIGADAGNDDWVAYTLKYNDVAVAFSGGLAVVTDASDINVGYPAVTNKTLKITIVDDGALGTNTGVFGGNNLDILPADTYSDVLTFTIAAKA